MLRHPYAPALEEWISTKDFSNDEHILRPKWHIPTAEEIQFANELLDLHFRYALDDHSIVCQTKIDQ